MCAGSGSSTQGSLELNLSVAAGPPLFCALWGGVRRSGLCNRACRCSAAAVGDEFLDESVFVRGWMISEPVHAFAALVYRASSPCHWALIILVAAKDKDDLGAQHTV